MTAIDLTQYPHTFETWGGPFGTGNNFRLFVTDRDIYIDSFIFKVGSAPTVPDAYDFRIVYSLDGEAFGAWDDSADLIVERTVTTVLAPTAVGDNLVVNKNYTLTGLQNGKNRIPAGAIVMVGSTNGNAGSNNNYALLRYHTVPA